MEARLGGPDRNLQDGGTFFDCEVVLIAEQEDGSACGRDAVEEGQEGLVGRLAETGVEGSEVFSWCVVERLPAAGVFEVRKGNTRSDSEGPGAEDGGLAQELELAEDLERSLLEDVVGEGSADESGDVAAHGRHGEVVPVRSDRRFAREGPAEFGRASRAPSLEFGCACFKEVLGSLKIGSGGLIIMNA
jgi:hypothetical protein